MTEGGAMRVVRMAGPASMTAVLAIFVAVRLAMLLTSDRIGHFEEERQGNLAVQLLEGGSADLRQHRYFDYQGSGVVGSLYNVPFYALLGPSGTVMKLAQLVLSTLLLLMLVLMANRATGEWAVWATGLMISFAPPLFVHYTFDTLAGSYYGCILNAALMLAASRAFLDGSRAWAQGWAFMVGFGVFLHPSTLIGSALTAGLMLLHMRSLAPYPRTIGLMLLSFFCGLSPLLWMGLGEASSLGMLVDAFLQRDLSESRTMMSAMDPVTKIASTLATDMPNALWSWGPRALGTALWIGLVTGLVSTFVFWRSESRSFLEGLVRRAAPAAMPLAIVPGLFAVLYLGLFLGSDVQLPVSGQMVHYAKNYKFLFNVVPFLILASGIAAGRAMDGPKVLRVLVLVLLSAYVSVGARSLVREISHGHVGMIAPYPSHDFAFIGRRITENCKLAEGAKACEQFEGQLRDQCIVGVGLRSLRHGRGKEGRDVDAACTCEAVAQKDRGLCVLGMGRDLAWRKVMDFDGAQKVCQNTGEHADRCMLGYMQVTGDLYHAMPDDVLARLVGQMPPERRVVLGRTLGAFYEARFGSDPDYVRDRCDRIERLFGLVCAAAL